MLKDLYLQLEGQEDPLLAHGLSSFLNHLDLICQDPIIWGQKMKVTVHQGLAENGCAWYVAEETQKCRDHLVPSTYHSEEVKYATVVFIMK